MTTVEQATNWLSERLGQSINPKDLRVRGKWIFLRHKKELVDCIPIGDDIYAETWDDIAYDKSPFVIKDKSEIDALVTRLNKSYDEYLIDCGLKNDQKCCLLAISGDCSEGAMSDHADYIPIDPADFDLIAEYIRNQNELTILAYQGLLNPSKKVERKYSKLRDQHHNLGNELIERGVFHHKYHKRTDWIITELDNNYPINLKAGATACIKGEG